MTVDSVRVVPYGGPCPKCGDNLTQRGPDRWCPTCDITVEAALEYIEELVAGSVTFGASDSCEAKCCYCGATLNDRQPRRLVWLPAADDPDDAISAHAHIRCPI